MLEPLYAGSLAVSANTKEDCGSLSADKTEERMVRQYRGLSLGQTSHMTNTMSRHEVSVDCADELIIYQFQEIIPWEEHLITLNFPSQSQSRISPSNPLSSALIQLLNFCAERKANVPPLVGANVRGLYTQTVNDQNLKEGFRNRIICLIK